MGRCVSSSSSPREQCDIFRISGRAFRARAILSSGHGRSTETLTPTQFLQCSALSKMTASIVTYPHEVIRTRLQTLRKPLFHHIPGAQHEPVPGIIRTAKSIVVNEGWRALYRGLSVNLVRTVPNSAVTMVT